MLMFHKPSQLGHVRPHTKFGLDQFGRYDVYQIQTDRDPNLQTNRQKDKKSIYIDCINYCFRIGCDFPMWMQYSLVGYMFSFLVLFSDFYYKVQLVHVLLVLFPDFYYKVQLVHVLLVLFPEFFCKVVGTCTPCTISRILLQGSWLFSDFYYKVYS